MDSKEFKAMLDRNPGRTRLQCAARGCDGCTVCTPISIKVDDEEFQGAMKKARTAFDGAFNVPKRLLGN